MSKSNQHQHKKHRKKSSVSKNVMQGLSAYGKFTSYLGFIMGIMFFLGLSIAGIYFLIRTDPIIDDKGNAINPKMLGGILLGLGIFIMILVTAQLWFVRKNKHGAAIVGGTSAVKQIFGAARH